MPSLVPRTSKEHISSDSKGVLFIRPVSYIQLFTQNSRLLVLFYSEKSYSTDYLLILFKVIQSFQKKLTSHSLVLAQLDTMLFGKVVSLTKT